MKRLADLVVSQSMLQVDQERANWLADLMANQDRTLMLAAWKETMAFDSRKRLAEIRCPTLVIAGSNDQGVPIHHAQMLHDGIPGSRLLIIDGADHALIWTHTDEFLRVTEVFLEA
jgi:3-oxoadipate enol-lactonase